MSDTTLMRARTWRWLKVRIVELLNIPESRLARVLNPPRKDEPRKE